SLEAPPLVVTVEGDAGGVDGGSDVELAQVEAAAAASVRASRAVASSGVAGMTGAARARAAVPAGVAQGEQVAYQLGESGLAQVVGVAVDDVLAEEHPHAGPQLDAAGGFLHTAVHGPQRALAPALDVDLGEVGPAATGSTQQGVVNIVSEHGGDGNPPSI